MQIFRGDIFYIEKNFHHEGAIISGSRPAVVVSNDIGNKHADFIEVVYLTSRDKKPLPTHANVICKVPSIAMCEQIDSIHKDRLGDFIRSCTADEMTDIDNALLVSLGLDSPIGTIAPMESAAPTYNIQYSESAEIDCLKKQLEESKHHIKVLECAKESFEAIIRESNADIRKLEIEKKVMKELYDQLLAKVVG